jgi:hypothetical protein
MPKPAAPSFVEPSVIPTVNDPRLRRLRLDDLMLISASERWAHAHFSDKVRHNLKSGDERFVHLSFPSATNRCCWCILNVNCAAVDPRHQGRAHASG